MNSMNNPNSKVGELEYKLNVLSESYTELENHNMELQNIINGNIKGNVKIPSAPKPPKLDSLDATGGKRSSSSGNRMVKTTGNSSNIELDRKIARANAFPSTAPTPAPSSSAATAMSFIQQPRPASGKSNRGNDSRSEQIQGITNHTRSSSSSPPRFRDNQSQQSTSQDSFRAVSPQKIARPRSKVDDNGGDDKGGAPETFPTKSEQRSSPYLHEDQQTPRDIIREDSFSTTSQSSTTVGGTKVKRKSLLKSVGKFIMGKNKEKKAPTEEES